MIIQLGTLGSLGMVGGSTPLVLSGHALIFLVLIIASKHLLRKGASKERRSTMEKKSNANTNISLSKSVHEALHEFAVSFGAGFLGGTIPSIGSATFNSVAEPIYLWRAFIHPARSHT